MARKVFISVLGTGFYEKCSYFANDFNSGELRFVQEASLKYIDAISWSETDTAIILLTASARKTNWDKNITERKRHLSAAIPEPYESLETCIEKLNLPFAVQDIDIPDGKNEEEMWEIFDILFNLIHNLDEIYFDLTHSFRYLPMLLLVFGNYVRFLKNAKVMHISYGNYEARNTTTNEAPFVDMLPLSKLQEWTYASANYLENGVTKKLVTLGNEELTPILAATQGKDAEAYNLRMFIKSLDEVVAERRTCRGMGIYNSNNFRSLKNSAGNITHCLIKPFNPLFEKIKDSMLPFNTIPDIQNGFAAAKWCFDFGLYQQAATILQENVVSFFCLRHEIAIDNETERELINKAFVIKHFSIPEKEQNLEPHYKKKFSEIINDAYFSNNKLLEAFINLTEVRNDFNHSGMRSKRDPFKPQALISNIEKALNTTLSILNEDNRIKTRSVKNQLINLSNHPSTLWSEAQKEAAAQFGECTDLPFPVVDPQGDEYYIESLAGKCVENVLALAGGHPAENITVHLMGEMNLTYALLTRLRDVGVPCVASTTDRQTVEHADGLKESQFRFVQFRNYF